MEDKYYTRKYYQKENEIKNFNLPDIQKGLIIDKINTKIKNDFIKAKKSDFKIKIFKDVSLIISIFLNLISFSLCQIDNINLKNYIKLTIIGQGSETKLLHTGVGLKTIYVDRPSELIINEKSIAPIVKKFDDGEKFLIMNIRKNTILENVIIKWNKTINNVKKMFFNIDSIISLDLSHLDTSLITDMSYMFQYCDINAVNLSNLNLLSVKKMDYMFEDSFIESIYLNNLNTKKLEDITYLFSGSKSLEYVYINNFDTSKVTEININNIFKGCYSLKSVFLSNLNFSNVKKMNNLFSDSPLLESLTLYNLSTKNLQDINHMLYNYSKLLYLNITYFDTSSVSDMSYAFAGCNSLISLNLSSFNTQSVTNMSHMFYNCTNLKYINMQQFYSQSKNEKLYYDIFYGTSDYLVYCINNKSENSIKSQLLTKKCAVQYCLDDWQTKIKKILNGSNKCLDSCASISYYEYKGICYPDCPEGTNSTKENKYICENKSISYTDKLINNFVITEDIKSDNDIDKEIINNELTKKGYDVKEYQAIVTNYIEKIKDGSFDNFLFNINEKNKTDYLIQSDNIIMQISSIDNQNNKKYDNISTINIEKECENILKKEYKITQNISLILIKTDYFIPGIKIPFIRYDIINPITKQILDLKFCDNTELNMDIPVTINETDLYKYNKNSDFYTDICKPYNKDGVDLTLFDRKYEYNFYNYSLCLNKCTFNGYDNITKKVYCKCDIQTQMSNLDFVEAISKDKLLDNFIDFKSISNFIIIKCVNKIKLNENIKSNICSCINIGMIFFLILFCILFYSRDLRLLFKKLDKIAKDKKEKEKENKNEIQHETTQVTNNNIIKQIRNSIQKKKKKKCSKNKSIFPSTTSKIKLGQSNNLGNTSKNKIILIYDSEINSYTYEEAIKNDKRNFFQYYISLVKTRHILISVFSKNDYNSNIIKLSLFFNSFALSFFINSLFFNDSTMHKIYEDGGIFNIAYSLPQIIYSFIISTVINALIKFLAFPEKDIIKIKQEKNYAKINHDLPKIKTKIKFKLALYFILYFGLLIFFWCYLTCFGAIYKNTQIYLLKDTLISYALSLVYPFFIYLIPSSLRIISIKHPEYLYKLSKLLQ